MSGGGAPVLPGAQGQKTFLGSSLLSTLTGLQSGSGGLRPTGAPAGFLGSAINNKMYDAMNPAPPPAPGAPPPPADPNNSQTDIANARKKARMEAGYGSASDILAGNSSGAPTTSSTVLLGS